MTESPNWAMKKLFQIALTSHASDATTVTEAPSQVPISARFAARLRLRLNNPILLPNPKRRPHINLHHHAALL